MGMAEDMKKIGDDIITSYDMRVKAVGALVSDVQKTLKGFATDRKKMSKEQAKALADFVTDLTNDVDNMIKRFATDRKKMSAEQEKALKRFATDLTKNVGAMIEGLQKEHKEMADNLREGFKKGEAQRLKSFKGMMGDINKCIKDIETYVANKLKEFNDAHADMSEALKKDLAKYVAGIVSETKKLLRGFEGERKKMAASWQGMAATMAKRRGIKPEVKAKVKVRPVEEAIEEEGEEEGIEDRILEVLEENPNGITLVEMAYAIGVPFQKLTGPTRRLISRGEVRKEDKLYFLA